MSSPYPRLVYRNGRLFDADGERFAATIGEDNRPCKPTAADKDTLRRVAAAWNAVDGFSTADLESLPEGALARLRAELAAALQAVATHDPQTCGGITPRDCLETVQEIARAALARLEPEGPQP